MNDALKDFSDDDLLIELIKRNKAIDTSRHVTYCYPHKTITIGIGNSEYADIVLSVEALEKLQELTKQDNE